MFPPDPETAWGPGRTGPAKTSLDCCFGWARLTNKYTVGYFALQYGEENSQVIRLGKILDGRDVFDSGPNWCRFSTMYFDFQKGKNY